MFWPLNVTTFASIANCHYLLIFLTLFGGASLLSLLWWVPQSPLLTLLGVVHSTARERQKLDSAGSVGSTSLGRPLLGRWTNWAQLAAIKKRTTVRRVGEREREGAAKMWDILRPHTHFTTLGMRLQYLLKFDAKQTFFSCIFCHAAIFSLHLGSLVTQMQGKQLEQPFPLFWKQ